MSGTVSRQVTTEMRKECVAVTQRTDNQRETDGTYGPTVQ